MNREGLAGKMREQLLVSEKEAEKVTYRAEPEVVVLGQACEFGVFVTPLCTFNIRDILVATGMTIGKESFNF